MSVVMGCSGNGLETESLCGVLCIYSARHPWKFMGVGFSLRVVVVQFLGVDGHFFEGC